MRTVKDSNGWSPLHWAACRDHLHVVKYLVEKGAEIDLLERFNRSPLFWAAGSGALSCVKYLAERGANINIVDFRGWVPMHWAAFGGWVDVMDYLLQQPGVALDRSDFVGETELFRAAIQGHLPAVRFLIEHGADKHRRSQEPGCTVMLIAAREGRLSVLRYLLEEAGVDPFVAADDGSSALHLAVEFDRLEIVTYLVENPITESLRERTKATIAARCTLKHVSNKVSTAIEAYGRIKHVGCDKCARNNIEADGDGLDGFYHCPTCGDDCCISCAGYPSMQTPLHVAAIKGRIDILLYLLRNGANQRSHDAHGKTYIDVMRGQCKLSFAVRGDFCIQELEASDHLLWFFVISLDAPHAQAAPTASSSLEHDLFERICSRVEALVRADASLASVKDANGRVAVDVASKPMREVIHSILLWHGRYACTDPRPEHISGTCLVFKACDEALIDHETGQPQKVAIKMMRKWSQFRRELAMRQLGFDDEFVVGVLATYPRVDLCTADGAEDAGRERPDAGGDVGEQGHVSKQQAESLYSVVMPLADRNLYVALKQERFAGRNLGEVRYIFSQLVRCVDHMHGRGVLHADIKTLNIVRTGGQWKLVDLDAACVIGQECVGHKSSSAYVPPEAVFVYDNGSRAIIRSPSPPQSPLWRAPCLPLLAHASFDVWSLGCILYQMTTADVRPLFMGSQEDNLSSDAGEEDSIFALAEWSTALKEKKLARVADPKARNLLAQMLHKDALRRPSLGRVLAHPFLSNANTARLLGEPPKYDVFLSYRVVSEGRETALRHVEQLYELLVAKGLRVFYDRESLEAGVNWKDGFVAGLISSKSFVPLLSRDAINNREKSALNWANLSPDSPLDNFLLEQRLAVELHALGFLDRIFPVFIGDFCPLHRTYGNYFSTGCHPRLPSVVVESVEADLCAAMEHQGLGTPLVPRQAAESVLSSITACQGAFIEGSPEEAFVRAASGIEAMLLVAQTAQTEASEEMPAKADECGAVSNREATNALEEAGPDAAAVLAERLAGLKQLLRTAHGCVVDAELLAEVEKM